MRSVLYTLAALAVLPLPVWGQSLPTTRCGVGIPQAESDGYVPLPQGDVFCPLAADPKAVRSFASFLRARATQVNPSTARAFDTDVGAVGIGDRIGLGRWNGARPNDGVQLSLEAGVFAQFDLSASSFDLLNADYVIGLPLTFRRGAFSGRARIYHQSSHLGDEFLLRPDDPEQERENLSFEASELILSVDWGALRLYGGGEYLVNRSPASLAKVVGHGGVELRPNVALFNVGPLATVRPVAMADVKLADDQSDRPATSVMAGFDIARRRDSDATGRRWMIVAHLYTGPSPYGQFYRDDIRYYGVGVSFNP